MTFLTHHDEGLAFLYDGQPMHILAGHDGRPSGFAAMEITVPGRFAGPIPHAHDEFDEAIYVLSGRLLVVGDGELHEAVPGSMFAAPRGTGTASATHRMSGTGARIVSLARAGPGLHAGHRHRAVARYSARTGPHAIAGPASGQCRLLMRRECIISGFAVRSIPIHNTHRQCYDHQSCTGLASKPTRYFRIKGGKLAGNDSTGTSGLNAQTLIRLMRDLATAPYRIERATTVPFDQKRYENDAEHSFSLGVAALCAAPLVDSKLDLTLMGTYALVHDLAEIYAGDTPVYSNPATRAAKMKKERVARAELYQKFGNDFPWLLKYLDDYIALKDEESKFVYALDKILPHVSVIIADYHPARPTWRAYKASEKIAREKVAAKYPQLSQVFEELCRMYAQLPHLFSTPPGKA